MNLTQDRYISNTFPKQKLPKSKKGDQWGKDCIDWILQSSSANRLTNYAKIKANYDLYNNIIDPEEFKYVTNPYGIDEEFPAKLNNFNIITPKLNLLVGEEIKRPFNFRAVAVNSDSVSQMQEKKKELLMQYLEAELLRDLEQQGINIQDPSAMDAMNPEQIEKYMNYSEADIRESTANKLLKYLIKKQNLEFKFNKGFKDALISDKEYYYIGIDGEEVYVKVINPLDFDYDANVDLDFVEDGQWARHTEWATPNQVLDEYHRDLTDSDISVLDSWGVEGTTGNMANLSINNTAHINNYHGSSGSGNYIPVTRVEWKSMRKIGFLKYYDENYEEQEVIVDEEYKPNKEAGEEIEWDWISEVWEGTKIGDRIYTRIRPKKVQYRSIDNPSICKLGFVGTTYNSRNSESTSLVDLVKHHQFLYNVIMYRMEMEIAKAKGKKMVMDLAQIPRSEGISLEKWMYYFDSIGIAFINSFEEGNGLGQGQTSNFNQFTAIDMSLSQSIGQYIGILNKIEEQCETLMGVSRQRQGAISSNETVGGVERAVVQSSNITEPLFFMHNEIKKNVLSHLLEAAKVVYPESKKINYITDDMNRIFLEMSSDFIDADYGIFITNSAKEVRTLEALRSIAEQSAASGLMTLTDLISIVDSDSIADIKNAVKTSEMKAEQAKQQEHQMAMEQIQAQGEQERLAQQELQDRLDNREYIKGEMALEREQVKALGFAQDQDVNDNGLPDVLEYEKLMQSSREHEDKMAVEGAKLNLEAEKLKVQERIAKQKADVDKIKARSKPKSSSK